MGNSVSVVEYKEMLTQLARKDLGNRDKESAVKFCEYSSDSSEQSMIFTSVTNEDIKSIKKNRPMNLLYIIREVIDIFYDNASSTDLFEDSEQINLTKGCINVLIRFLPFIMDDKAYMDKILWDGDDLPAGVKL